MTSPQVITAVPTAFHDDGAVDLPSSRRVIEHVLDGGVDGVFVNGTTAEFVALSRDERRQLMVAALDVAGADRVIVHVGASSPYEVRLLAADAREIGVRRMSVLTPFYLSASLAGVARQIEAVAAEPYEELFLYLFPDRTGVDIPATHAAGLIEAHDLAGAKVSIPGTAYVRELVESLPAGRRVLSGNDGLIPELAEVGGAGVVSGVSSALPRPFVQLARAVAAGDAEAVGHLAPSARGLVSLLGPSIYALKLSLVHQGIFAGAACRMAIDAPRLEECREIERVSRRASSSLTSAT